MHRLRRTTAITASAVVALAMVIPISPAAAADPPWQVVASGLDSPRHLTYASGDLYVVEAGRGGTGPCATHPLGVFCLGTTGAVTRVGGGRVVTDLPSITNGAETLGPSDIEFTGTRKYVLSIGIGGSPEFRAAFGDAGKPLGTLVTGKLDKPGYSLFADVLQNEADANPDDTDFDSNPVGILRQGSAYQVADAGGNSLVRAAHQGTFTTTAVFAPVPATLPPFTGLPADAVPTAVVEGPDHALYVSQLTGFPFEKGAASIWRVVPGQDPVKYAWGLTNMTDLAFGKDGSLYAVQISNNGLASGDPMALPLGSLVKITPGSAVHQTIAGDLPAPYGVALVKDTAYVSVCSVCTGAGQVIKIPLT